MIPISKRVQAIQPSHTVRLDTQAKQLIAEGKSIINLSVGELDFDPIPEVIASARQALNADVHHYTNPQGSHSLREAVCSYYARAHNVHYDPSQVLITNGAKQGLFSCFQALVNPGDEVIIPIPGWVSYSEQVALAGGVAISVQCTEQFQLDLNAIAAAITDTTVGIVLNYPNNPTGAVYSRAQLEQIAALAEQHDIWVVSDEIYERLLYGVDFVSFAALAYDRAIIINGLSKSSAMTGWRVGYVAGPADFIQRCKALQSHLAGNVSNIVQAAATTALQHSVESTTQYLKILDERCSAIMQWVDSEAQLDCHPPQGAFYVFINIQNVTKNSEEFCERLLHRFGVALIPGKYFGTEGYVRMSFANSLDSITEACARISKCVASYA